MTSQDDVMRRLADAIGAGQRGDRVGARAELDRLWRDSTRLNAVTRCGIAHSLADVQDRTIDELGWDLQALMCALGAVDGDAADLGMADGVAGLMPSLHLNLADVYRRLGQFGVAHGHVLEARASIDRLDENPYLATIADALDRLTDELDRGDSS